MKITAISDTHGAHHQLSLPAGDMLLHAGDISLHGKYAEIVDFLEWFAAQDFEFKVFVAGNHDAWAESSEAQLRQLVHAVSENSAHAGQMVYLNGESVTLGGLKVWGSPVTPRFMDWSFMREPGADIASHWAGIPADTDLLLTHCPPFGLLDEVQLPLPRSSTVADASYKRVGCPELIKRIRDVKPHSHVFGHIHESYGHTVHSSIRFFNTSIMNNQYRVQNVPVSFDCPTGEVDQHDSLRTDGVVITTESELE